MASTEKHRIFLIGRHPVCRHGLAQIINAEKDLIVCGELEELPLDQEEIAVAGFNNADMVVVDFDFETAEGYTPLKRFRSLCPSLAVLLVSDSPEPHRALELLRTGVRGVVMKTEALRDFVAAIRDALAGEIYLNRDLGQQLITDLARGNASRDLFPEDRLTVREREILRLIASGQSNRDIAFALGVSARTVETHRRHIKEKMGFTTTSELLQYALSHSPPSA